MGHAAHSTRRHNNCRQFFFFITRPGRTVALILTLNGSNDVFLSKGHDPSSRHPKVPSLDGNKEGPFGCRDDGSWPSWVTSCGENMSKKLSNDGRKQTVSSQNAKIYTSQYISGTIIPTNKRFEDQVQTMKCSQTQTILTQSSTIIRIVVFVRLCRRIRIRILVVSASYRRLHKNSLKVRLFVSPCPFPYSSRFLIHVCSCMYSCQLK